MPLVPRRGCTVSSTSVGVEAECIQCSLPATRRPVSSKWTTGADLSRARTTSRVAATALVIRRVQLTTVPAATAAPNRSASACTVREVDRNCPCSR